MKPSTYHSYTHFKSLVRHVCCVQLGTKLGYAFNAEKSEHPSISSNGCPDSNEINTKNYWKEKKEIVCVRLRSEDKHHLRKSADRKAQISPVSGTNAFLICAFRSADFLRWRLSSERNLTRNLFFLFPIVFSISLIHFFDEKKDGAAGNSIVCFGASILMARSHLTGKTKSANFTNNGNCLEESNVLGNGKCELNAIYKLRCKFLARKVQNPSPILALLR